VANRNITVSLPEEVLEEAKVIAVRRRTSVSALLRGMLDDLVAEETGYRQAERRFIELQDRGFDLGTNGQIGWTRDETHER
jgi:metal-responsive CopG/Arc/MetJ family transcriptional regulator